MPRTPFQGIVISHLGNIEGRQPERENRLAYVQQALKLGWHVCVDVVYKSGGFILPHDNGFDTVPAALLSKQRVWCRAYTAETLDALCGINAHCFFMTQDFLSLTTAQFIWTMPPHPLSGRSIAAFPELTNAAWLAEAEPAGLCSNEPLRYI